MKFHYQAIALALTAAATPLFAGTLYLDTNGSAAGFGLSVTANWGDAVWTADSTGQSATSTWVAGSDAVLGSSLIQVQLGASAFDVASISTTGGNITISTEGPGGFTREGDMSLSAAGALSINAPINLGTNTLTNLSSSNVTFYNANTIGSYLNNTAETAITRINNNGALGQGVVNNLSGVLDLHLNNPTFTVLTGKVSDSNVIAASLYTGTVISHVDISTDTGGAMAEGSYRNASIIMREGALSYGVPYGDISIEGPNARFEIANSGQSAEANSITINDGTLDVHSSQSILVQNDLFLNTGTYTQSVDGFTSDGNSTLVYYLNIDGTGKIQVNGNAYIDGTLEVRLEPEFNTENIGITVDTAILLLNTAGTVVGSFSNLILPDLPTGFEWDTSELYAYDYQLNLYIRTSNVPEPATAAALAGILALSFTATRRKRRD